MSSRKKALDRGARRALKLVGVVLLALLVIPVWSYISRVTQEHAPVSAGSTDERLVVIDNRSLIVQPEHLGEAMSNWLKATGEKSLSFEFGSRSFQANSAVPRPITVSRVGQVASLAKASPTITVHILKPAYKASSIDQKLDDQRATRVRDALLASGVNESQVTIDDESDDLPFAKSPYLAVLLSKGPNSK